MQLCGQKPHLMRITIVLTVTLLWQVCHSQHCETGNIDPRVSANLAEIGDLKPGIAPISIEQLKQDGTAHAELYPQADVRRVTITTDSIPIYIFNATHRRNIPVILYFHPGGFVTPFLPFMRYDCWKMSKDLKAIVYAVDYRIAPTHKFPTAVNDAYTSFEWLLTHARTYGGDIDRLVVAGLSAGANLATVVSNKATTHGLSKKIKLQVLNCPSIDNYEHQDKYLSYQKYASRYFLTREFMTYAQKAYCEKSQLYDPDFAPIYAKNLLGVPPVVMFTTEFDILRDEEMAYLNKLREAGTTVWHHCFPGQIHCLVGLPEDAEEFNVMNDIILKAMDVVIGKR